MDTPSIQEKNQKNQGLAISEGNQTLYKKTQKIVTAVYIVTNFLSETDPLRGSLRDASLKILSLMGSIVFESHSNLKKVISDIRSHSNQIISMLEVAFYAGYISEMNYKILAQELQAYIDETGALNTMLENSFTLKESDVALQIPSLNELKTSAHSTPKIEHKTEYKGHRAIAPKASRPMNSQGTVFVKKQGRKEAIMEVLSKRESVTIKDIVEVVSDCSEKTIQRELISLVKNGVLKKSGERRWSTYSLA